MRSYSGFLLFEDVFDNVPNGNLTLSQFADSVFRPSVLMSVADCGTQLGKIVDVSPALEGYIELATNQAIDQNRILYLFSKSIYKIAIRDLHSCTAPGGICQECFKGTYPQLSLPAVGSTVKLSSTYVIGVDQFTADGKDSSFALSRAQSEYDSTLLYQAGVMQTTGYTISGQGLFLPSAPALGTLLSLRYLKATNKPFFGYLAQTYSGALLGVRALPTQNIMVRESLIKELLSDGQLDHLMIELGKYSTIPVTYLEYAKGVTDRLEKALLIIMLYCVYSNIHV